MRGFVALLHKKMCRWGGYGKLREFEKTRKRATLNPFHVPIGVRN